MHEEISIFVFQFKIFCFLLCCNAFSCSVDRYDMWSVGVVFLEMILGSPNVFQINAITRALLDHHLEGWSENLKELACK